MKLILQRVRRAQVKVEQNIIGRIGEGMLIFLGVGKDDSTGGADYLARKIVNLRIFDDEQGKMNLSALEVKAEILVVSQFTLYGDCVKGRRPSFERAAEPGKAEELYDYFVRRLKEEPGIEKVETGRFKAMMDIELVNNGPVTLILDTTFSRN